jgi:aspartate/methionine/tyrosine aminotransferase
MCQQPKETLLEIARFCGRHGLHLISDEIFAQSVYETPHATDPVPFSSILSLDLTGCVDPHLVHVAYGMSKDYSANGFRLAALHSRNQGLLVAVTSVW